MNKGGGHTIRHLRDEGLIPNKGSLQSQVENFRQLTRDVLTTPEKSFDWKIGDTQARAFAGTTRDGDQVVLFVAKEGPHQGKVLSAVVPDAGQIAKWGL